MFATSATQNRYVLGRGRVVCRRGLGVLAAVSLLALAVAAGRAQEAGKQVSAIEARHASGQTFLTWREPDCPVLQDSIRLEELRRIAKQLDQQKVRYRIYRSDRPIASVEGLRPIAEVPPLSCWNADFHGGEVRPETTAFRYAIEEGRGPVRPGTGISVHNPSQAGEAYYAVTVSTDGKENRTIGRENALQSPIRESVGRGVPVLQRVERPKEFNYVRGPTLHYYTRWESPPNCAEEGKPFDYVVAVPPKPVGPAVPAKPAPVGIHLHCWGANLNGGYGWWYNAEKGHILLASNQIPYDWWTGYHELYWKGRADKETWQKGVVRPYTQQRLFSFLDWMTTKWQIDLTRTHVAGSSMGGAGSPMMAIRYPERIAWAISWVGIHVPAKSPQFAGSYAQVYGPPEWNVRFEDGTPAWDYFSDVWYLRKYPNKEIGLITFSNGKNDGAIGWPQAVEFHRALQETRRPHIFVWGQSGHGQRASMPVTLEERVMPIDLRTDQSLPAFTRCSLDDQPGSGDPKDGDAKGQSNLYLSWETKDIVDRPDRWELTVGLIEKAPRDECTVDITPRRLQQFRAAPGQTVKWTNTSPADGKQIQSGEATADRWGLVTLDKVRVTKGKNRISIRVSR